MILLGSTGSIGVNALKIAREFDLSLDVLTGGKNIELLAKQALEFSPQTVVCLEKQDIQKLKSYGVKSNILYGENGIYEAIAKSNSKIGLNAIVGFAGLKPTIWLEKYGKKIALANKESLVCAGNLIDTKNIIPVDSEHFAIWYAIENKIPNKITITASGGALRNMPIENIQNASINDVLAHPNWSMGQKITVDSATMVNKLFEILEAKWLFNSTSLDAVIEEKSLIHAIIDFIDGASLLQASNPDMRLPIAYSLCCNITKEIVPAINWTNQQIIFRDIDIDRYPLWKIKQELIAKPYLGIALNAMNEVLVAKFLNTEIKFGDISTSILKVFNNIEIGNVNCVEDIFEIDKKYRSIF